jgi:hypothetical protein
MRSDTVYYGSQRYLYYGVSAKQLGVAVDPSQGTSKLAYVAQGSSPDDATWLDVDGWYTEADGDHVVYIMFGTAVQLSRGTYDVYFKNSLSPEQPLLPAGVLYVR